MHIQVAAANSEDCFILSEIALDRADTAEFLYVNRLHEASGWAMKGHAHPYHELIVIVRGIEKVIVQGRTLTGRAGDMFFFPAGVVHEEWAGGASGLDTLFLGFEWSGHRAGMPILRHDSEGRIQELASWLEAEYEAYFPGAAAFRRALLGAIVAEYLRLAAHQEQDIVERVRSYIRAHLDARFTVGHLAQCAGVSKFHFIRQYRTLTGLTPMEDARRIRLETARHMLLTTDLPLKTVAPRVGFANEYHLSRLLKSRLGVGARELRGNHAVSRSDS